MFCATYYILPARIRMIETTPVTNRIAMVSLDKVASSLGRFLIKLKSIKNYQQIRDLKVQDNGLKMIVYRHL